MKRPLIGCLFGLSSAIILVWFQVNWLLFLIFPISLVALIFFGDGKGAFVILLFYITGIVIAFPVFNSEALLPYFGERALIEGKVKEIDKTHKDRVYLTLETKEINQQTLETGLLIVLDQTSSTQIKVGDHIELTGKIIQPSEKRNPGCFNYALYLKSKKIYGQVWVDSIEELKVVFHEDSLWSYAAELKNRCATIYDRVYTKEQATLIKSLVLGEKAESEDMMTLFQEAGIAHVLAISGLHVGYLFLLVQFLFKKLKTNVRLQSFWMAVILGFYVLITGGSISVVRAALMLWLSVFAITLKESSDSLNNLAFAAILILLGNPAQLFSVSFQLSFLAILGIVMFYKPINYKLNKQNHHYLENIILTSIVSINILPILLINFHVFNFMTFIGNILIVPLIGFLLLYNLLMMPFLSLSLLRNVLAYPSKILCNVILFLTRKVANITVFKFFGTINIGLFIIGILLLLGLSGYFDLSQKKHRYRFYVSIGLIGIVLMVSNVLPKPLRLTFIDVGEGDALLIQTPQEHAFLVDGGGYENSDDDTQPISEKTLLPLLYSKNIRKLDGVFITHNHADHAQGIEEILQKMPVKEIFLSNKYNGNLEFQNKIPVTFLKQGDVLTTEDGVQFDIFWPEGERLPLPEDEQNAGSLMMNVSYQAFDAFLTGDAESTEEEAVLEILPDVDLLKVGHHGSKNATSMAFLKALQPEYAIISVGANNFYGHPTAETLERLQTEGSQIYRTDEDGAILVASDGKTVKIKKMLE